MNNHLFTTTSLTESPLVNHALFKKSTQIKINTGGDVLYQTPNPHTFCIDCSDSRSNPLIYIPSAIGSIKANSPVGGIIRTPETAPNSELHETMDVWFSGFDTAKHLLLLPHSDCKAVNRYTGKILGDTLRKYYTGILPQDEEKLLADSIKVVEGKEYYTRPEVLNFIARLTALSSMQNVLRYPVDQLKVSNTIDEKAFDIIPAYLDLKVSSYIKGRPEKPEIFIFDFEKKPDEAKWVPLLEHIEQQDFQVPNPALPYIYYNDSFKKRSEGFEKYLPIVRKSLIERFAEGVTDGIISPRSR